MNIPYRYRLSPPLSLTYGHHIVLDKGQNPHIQEADPSSSSFPHKQCENRDVGVGGNFRLNGPIKVCCCPAGLRFCCIRNNPVVVSAFNYSLSISPSPRSPASIRTKGEKKFFFLLFTSRFPLMVRLFTVMKTSTELLYLIASCC